MKHFLCLLAVTMAFLTCYSKKPNDSVPAQKQSVEKAVKANSNEITVNEQPKKSSNAGIYVIGTIGVVSLIISIGTLVYTKNRYNDLMHDIHMHHKHIPTSQRTSVMQSENTEKRIKDLESRLLSLEKERVEAKRPTFTSAPKVEVERPIQKEVSRVFYVGIPKGDGVFNDDYRTLTDESMFKVTSLGDRATFTPIDFKRIKCSNSSYLAINSEGVEQKDAEGMDIQEEGKLVKEDNYWRIQEKVKVRFY